MEIEQSFRNGQAKPESAELPGDRAFALMESFEDLILPLRLNADAGVADFEYKPLSLIK